MSACDATTVATRNRDPAEPAPATKLTALYASPGMWTGRVDPIPGNTAATYGGDHTSVTGPKSAPSRAVPRRWTRNSAARITTVAGTTYSTSRGVATLSPSIALRTEMAGVMTPSP